MTLPTIADCIKAVADVSGVRVEDILGEQCHKPLVIYRQVAMYIAHQKTCQSLQTIGRSFRRDHTTILYGVRRIKKEIGSNEVVDSLIRQASAILAAQEVA